MPGCEHYIRNCDIKAQCCGRWFACRLCHDAANLGHNMDRFATEELMCTLCKTVQPVSNVCIEPSCQTSFAKYFCDKCKFFDSTPNRSIYHCDQCKICRLGRGLGQDVSHCNRCGTCVPIEIIESHHCVQDLLDRNCPICGCYMFSSTKPTCMVQCGHAMHFHCLENYAKYTNTCPECNISLRDLVPYNAEGEVVRIWKWILHLFGAISQFLRFDR